MNHEDFIRNLIKNVDANGRIKNRERQDLEYKEKFGMNSVPKYAKSMAAFANNQGGYLVFGIRDNPREIIGVNKSFDDFPQERFTEQLNSTFSPEIDWECGKVEFGSFSIGFIYTYKASSKPVVAIKSYSSEKINDGDIYYRYRARTEHIKYPELIKIIEDRERHEREGILKLMETIKKSGTANLGIVNYNNGRFRTPNGVDVAVDRKIVTEVLRKARYIKEGSFNETNGIPVIKITGNIDLAEEVPVPDVEPDIQYPYLQKQLAEKLNITSYQIQTLIWKYQMKEQKKFHIEVSATSNGKSKVHKYSDIALQYLADRINEHKNEPNWLQSIAEEFKINSKKRRAEP